MPRRIEFAGSSEQCDRLLDRLRDNSGVARIVIQRDARRNPDGDVLILDAANQDATGIVNLLDELGFLHEGTVTITEPSALISDRQATPINEEGNDAIWEEIGAMMRQDTNPSLNFLLLMALSGAVAGFGIASDTLHIVVGAMLIAPGFEPVLRIAFGLLGHRHSTLAGLRSAAVGYGALAAGGAVAIPVALALEGLSPADLPDLFWADYWSSVQPSGIAVSLFAGIAGGVIVSTRMKVLSTGVMVALALVPSMTLVGIGLVTANFELALGAFGRWIVEVLAILIGGGGILALKRMLLHHRRKQRA